MILGQVGRGLQLSVTTEYRKIFYLHLLKRWEIEHLKANKYMSYTQYCIVLHENTPVALRRQCGSNLLSFSRTLLFLTEYQSSESVGTMTGITQEFLLPTISSMAAFSVISIQPSLWGQRFVVHPECFHNLLDSTETKHMLYKTDLLLPGKTQYSL